MCSCWAVVNHVACGCSCHLTLPLTPSDRKDTTVTDFTPTHRVIANHRSSHGFSPGDLVRATGARGERSGLPEYERGTDHLLQCLDADEVEELKSMYEDGKLYTVTRTMRYDARTERFTPANPLRGAPGAGVRVEAIDQDPSASAVRIPDPLPTGFGAVVRKDGKRYSRVDTDSPPWRREGDGGWYSDADLVGADVLYPGDPQ